MSTKTYFQLIGAIAAFMILGALLFALWKYINLLSMAFAILLVVGGVAFIAKQYVLPAMEIHARIQINTFNQKLLQPTEEGFYPYPVTLKGGQVRVHEVAAAVRHVQSRGSTQIVDALPFKAVEGPKLIAPPYRDEPELPFGQMLHGYIVKQNRAIHEHQLERITGKPGKLRTIFVASGSGGGKSTLGVLVAMGRTMAENRHMMIVFDPHKDATLEDDEALPLMQRMPALEDYCIMEPVSDRPEDLQRVRDFLRAEIDARKNGYKTLWSDMIITVIVDEVRHYAALSDAGKDPIYDEIFYLMEEIATQTAKMGIHGLYMTQLATKERLGPVDIRAASPTKITLSLAYEHAFTLLRDSKLAIQATRLRPGEGFISQYGNPEIVPYRFGYIDAIDVAREVAKLPGPRAPNYKNPGNPWGNCYDALATKRDNVILIDRERSRALTSTVEGANEGANAAELGERTGFELASQADFQRFLQVVREYTTKEQIIWHTWAEKKGSSIGYQDASAKYESYMRTLADMAQRGIKNEKKKE